MSTFINYVTGLGSQANIRRGVNTNTTPSFFDSARTEAVSAIQEVTKKVPSGLSSWIAYGFAALIVIIIILLFIHFTITPIFQFRPGGPGYIPVPGGDNGAVYWEYEPSTPLPDTKTILGNSSGSAYNYSFTLDIFIENPLELQNVPRMIFYRGEAFKPQSKENELQSIKNMLELLTNYNVAVSLAPDTTDLIVSVLNNKNQAENVYIPNIPVQESFRLGVIIMEYAMEVYINGYLVETRTFTSSPKEVSGPFNPPVSAGNYHIRNLHIWKRIVSPAEIRYAKPSLADSSAFNAKPVPSSVQKSCATSADTTTAASQ